jgi:hypothetical protein
LFFLLLVSVIKEILGYKFEDIIECSSKFEFDQCFICQKLRAGVKCAVEGCIHRWHYPCGYDSCVTIFDGDFRSYCKSHIPESFKAIQFENSIQPCLACYEEIGKFNPVLTIISSCCSKTENFKTKFLHKKCLMQYTRNAGFDSMCILCDEYDKKVWQKEMKNKGIYIPGQAAIWELDGSFDDQVKQKCTHPDCDIKNNRDVFTCYICGTEPRHLKCVGAETHSQYLCSKCYGENFVKIVIPDKFPKE